MNIAQLLTALNNLETSGAVISGCTIDGCHLELEPDGSGCVQVRLKPNTQGSTALRDSVQTPCDYTVKSGFDTLPELQTLCRLMQTEPESIKWTACEK